VPGQTTAHRRAGLRDSLAIYCLDNRSQQFAPQDSPAAQRDRPAAETLLCWGV